MYKLADWRIMFKCISSLFIIEVKSQVHTNTYESCVSNVSSFFRVVEMQEMLDQQEQDEAAEFEGRSTSGLASDIGNKR